MFLEKIVREKLKDLRERQMAVPLAELQAAARDRAAPLDLGAALKGGGPRLIAEVKRASPSRGILRTDLDPAGLARIYAENGAAAISVLTEASYFRGSRQDLEAVRKAVPHIPVLRKDFILAPYQVFESRAWGADAVLLICAILEEGALEELLGLAHELGMKALVEVHSGPELEKAIAAGARIIGINNRDLGTLKVDINMTGRLRPLVPPGRLVVSESGIKGREEIAKLRQWGVDAMLVGEALVTAPDVGAKMRELL
jgi:indole-3-glycerol phosphate synthase